MAKHVPLSIQLHRDETRFMGGARWDFPLLLL